MAIKKNSPLGTQTCYPKSYNPTLLFPIPRKKGRDSIGIKKNIKFYGVDIWNAYEVSWLDSKGKPLVATAQISFQCDTKNIIESKSLKLYLNSMNQMKFESKDEILSFIKNDITKCAEGNVKIILTELKDLYEQGFSSFSGLLLDDLDITVDSYDPNPFLLAAKKDAGPISETLYSHLLKTNCPVTNQPDWASIMIRYTGQPIDKICLLRYIISYRNQQDYHEQCVERIYSDIFAYCAPIELEVYARYTRRGGLDINPYRSSKKIDPPLIRISRQ